LKESLIKNQTIKDLNFYSKFIIYNQGNEIIDEACIILNEILLKNKVIEKLDLSCNFIIFNSKKKVNQIKSKDLIFLKKSLKKNNILNEIIFYCKL
jgi:hypothetical protein